MYFSGLRFAELETKLAVATLITKYNFSPSPKTPKYVELDRNAMSHIYEPPGGVFVRITKL